MYSNGDIFHDFSETRIIAQMKQSMKKMSSLIGYILGFNYTKSGVDGI